jgi:glycosyltransferase involved in cell wall biosynthesis
MKLSVVIPAFNEEAFLPHLLQSLQKQTCTIPYEVIVVDNNSTDKTAEIAHKYGAKVVFEKTPGYAFACNAGFAAATGEIIARADADYVQPPEWLQNIWDAFEKDPKLVALGGPLYPLESHVLENVFYYPSIVIWMYLLKLLGRGFLFPNMAVKKSFYEKTGGFDTHLQFGEDTEMCLKLKRLGKVAYMPHIYVYTSIRRVRSLGVLQTLFGYSIGNQIAMWMGKKATIGLDVVRTIPTGKPRQYKPWIFLYAVPAGIVTFGLLLFSLIQQLP